MTAKAKVVLTDYVWEKLDVEHEILGELAEIAEIGNRTEIADQAENQAENLAS